MPRDTPPQTHPPDRSSDFTDCESASRILMEVSGQLVAMSAEVAKARVVIEYSADRRKMALAVAFKRAKESGCTSATEAEHFARASKEYEAAMLRLEQESLLAETVQQRHRALESKFEAARSVLSLEKTKIGML